MGRSDSAVPQRIFHFFDRRFRPCFRVYQRSGRPFGNRLVFKTSLGALSGKREYVDSCFFRSQCERHAPAIGGPNCKQLSSHQKH